MTSAGSLKLTGVGIFTPWKSSNIINLDFVVFHFVAGEPAVKHLPAYYCSPHDRNVILGNYGQTFPSSSFP